MYIVHIHVYVLLCALLYALLSFQKNRHIIFHVLVALKLLVSLLSSLAACSARIVVDRQTHRTTTVTLAAHAPRVNLTVTLEIEMKASRSQSALQETLNIHVYTVHVHVRTIQDLHVHVYKCILLVNKDYLTKVVMLLVIVTRSDISRLADKKKISS